MANNLTNFWNSDPSAQKAVRQVINPRCGECGKPAQVGQACWYCDHALCASCTRAETWGDRPINVCVSCHQAGKELGVV